MRNWHRGAGNLKGGSINYSTSLINFIVTSLWTVGPKDKSPTVYIYSEWVITSCHLSFSFQ